MALESASCQPCSLVTVLEFAFVCLYVVTSFNEIDADFGHHTGAPCLGSLGEGNVGT